MCIGVCALKRCARSLYYVEDVIGVLRRAAHDVFVASAIVGRVRASALADVLYDVVRALSRLVATVADAVSACRNAALVLGMRRLADELNTVVHTVRSAHRRVNALETAVSSIIAAGSRIAMVNRIYVGVRGDAADDLLELKWRTMLAYISDAIASVEEAALTLEKRIRLIEEAAVASSRALVRPRPEMIYIPLLFSA